MKYLFLSMLGIALSLNTTAQESKYPESRFYYNFKTQTLLKGTDQTAEVFRPLRYRANRDLKIEIFNYNPLRTVVGMETNSSVWFLADTAALSKYITLPVSTTPSDKGVDVIKSKDKTCQILDGKLRLLKGKDEELTEAIYNYHEFISLAERISGVYEILRNLEELRPTNVNSSLRSYIQTLNDFFQTHNITELNADPNITLKQDIDIREVYLRKKISDKLKEASEIKKDMDNASFAKCKEQFNEFESTFTKIKEHGNVFENEYADKIAAGYNKLLLTYTSLQPYLISTPTFVCEAVNIDHDEHKIIIYKKEYNETQMNKYDVIDVEPVRGFKIDVAGGFFVGTIGNHTFNLKTMDSITAKKYLIDGQIRDTIVSESYTAFFRKKQFPISFGAMIYLHGHTQNSGLINYGFSLGFGAQFDDQARWVGTLGPTVLIGKKQRFNINPGLMLTQVDRLEKPYQSESWYQENIDNVPTYRAWKIGFSLGFSWNLSTNK